MNVTKCINGHFFDADKYQLCPHCGASVPNGTEAAPETKKSHVSFWGKKKKETSDVSLFEMPDKTIGKTFGVFGTEEKNQEPCIESEEVATKIKECPLCGKTYDSSLHTDCPNCAAQRMEANKEVAEKNDAEIKEAPIATRRCPECNQTYNQFSLDDESCPHCGYNPQKTEHSNNENESLSAAVKKAVSGNEGKTVGFFSTQTKENGVVSGEPVVGWLVCVKGSHFGESFNIYAGRNSIGRGETNKINIARDNAVSRSKHAWLTYEPKKRDFYIQPGEGSGLSYLNGDTVMESKKMQTKDLLEIGNSQYILIPLCDETFTWEDYINKE